MPKITMVIFLVCEHCFVFQMCQPQTKETIVSRANEPLVNPFTARLFDGGFCKMTLTFDSMDEIL